MWIWLDKTGKVYQSLVHGNAPTVGETDFKIFAYFDGLNPESVNAATIKFRRPDMQGSSYPVLYMTRKNMIYSPMSSDGANCLFKTANNPYRGFVFDFSSFLSGQEIVRLLDTPGMWEATITLLRYPSKTNVTGLIKFYVGASAGDNEEASELSEDQVLENLVLSLNSLNQLSTTYVKVVLDLETEASDGELDSNIFSVGSVVYDKETQGFYKITSVTENPEDDSKVFATYEKDFVLGDKLDVFNGIYIAADISASGFSWSNFENGQIIYDRATGYYYEKDSSVAGGYKMYGEFGLFGANATIPKFRIQLSDTIRAISSKITTRKLYCFNTGFLEYLVVANPRLDDKVDLTVFDILSRKMYHYLGSPDNNLIELFSVSNQASFKVPLVPTENDDAVSKKYTDDKIKDILQKSFQKVDTTTYPTLEDFLGSTGDEGYIYLYPVDLSESPTFESGYYQYIWEDNGWVSLGTTKIDTSSFEVKFETLESSDGIIALALKKNTDTKIVSSVDISSFTFIVPSNVSQGWVSSCTFKVGASPVSNFSLNNLSGYTPYYVLNGEKVASSELSIGIPLNSTVEVMVECNGFNIRFYFKTVVD